MLVPLAFALAGTFFNALATLLERRSGRDAPPDSVFSWRLSAYLFRHPLWLTGIAAQVAAFACEAAALRRGQLSFVEPIMTTDLLFLLAMLGVAYRVPLRLREWSGAGLVVLGLAGFLAAAEPHGGTALAGPLAWGSVFGAVALAVALSIGIGLRLHNPYRVILFGLGNGCAFALTEALTKLVVNELPRGIPFLFTHGGLYALLAAGATAVIFMQHTYSAGPLAASQPALMAAGTLGAVLIGVFVFHDALRHSPGALGAECLAGAALFAGIVLLSGSRTLSNVGALRSRAEAETPGASEAALTDSSAAGGR